MNLCLCIFVAITIFYSVNCDQNLSSLYIDVERTTDKIKLTSLSDFFSQNNHPKIKNKEFKRNEIQTDELSNSVTELTTESIEQSHSTKNSFEEMAKTESIKRVKNKDSIELISETGQLNHSKVEISITSYQNSINNLKITKTEIKTANQTLVSTILLRLHSILQYSGNFSSQAVIPYVYLTKIQIDSLYRQILESTFLQNYLSNLYQLILSDVMNQECNILSTMMNYVLIPAIEAKSGSNNYLIERTRKIVDEIGRWHDAFKRWSAQLSTALNYVAELKFEECGQNLLCSLGKARYQSLREEPRQYRGKIIRLLNNLFNMPMLEKRIKRNYLEARQYGASGGSCESFKTNCVIPSENFDVLINLVKQLF